MVEHLKEIEYLDVNNSVVYDVVHKINEIIEAVNTLIREHERG